MSAYRLSFDDRHFRTEFEACRFSRDEFDHRAHLRLAYAYLAENDTETAVTLMRRALLAFLQHHNVDVSKYHETMTRAWILAVRHFLEITPASSSADRFIEANPILLDTKIMLSHYSVGVLFSDQARARFVTPDLEEIPRHDR